ncbi:hypothetical protein GPALN_012717 [Globodera pallida]|nr:hypothetical protein GPALN_012717 [Globodera pallida]
MPLQCNGFARKSVKLRKGDISRPTNFIHRIHADYDPRTGDLRGLPSQWAAILGSDFLAYRRKKMLIEDRSISNKTKAEKNLRNPDLVCAPAVTSQHSDFRALIASFVNSDYDPRAYYSNFVEIGSGSSGRVFCANSPNGATVAVKCMNINEQKRRYLLLNEILIPRELSHQNLIKFIDSFLVADQLWVVSEFAAMGSLTRIVTQRRMPEPLIATVCLQVLRALAFLHERRIVHRDVKSDSILIDSRGTVKLSDFGFCARLTMENPFRRSLLGTPYWLSSQVACKEKYGTDADIWSLGVTIFEMVLGEPPYFDLSPEAAVRKIISDPAPRFPEHANVSVELASFSSAMLQKDRSLRSSAHQLLAHPFLQKALHPTKLLQLFNGLKD